MKKRLIALTAVSALMISGCGFSDNFRNEDERDDEESIVRETETEAETTKVTTDVTEKSTEQETVSENTAEGPEHAAQEDSDFLVGTWEVQMDGETTTICLLANHVAYELRTDPDTGETNDYMFPYSVDLENRFDYRDYYENSYLIEECRVEKNGDTDEIHLRYGKGENGQKPEIVMRRVSKDTGKYAASAEDLELARNIEGIWEYSVGEEYYQRITLNFMKNGFVEIRYCGEYGSKWHSILENYCCKDGKVYIEDCEDDEALVIDSINADAFTYHSGEPHDIEDADQISGRYVIYDLLNNTNGRLFRIEPKEDYYIVRDNVHEAVLSNDYIEEMIVGKWQIGKHECCEFTKDGKLRKYLSVNDEEEALTEYDYEIRSGRVYVTCEDEENDYSYYFRIERLDEECFEAIEYSSPDADGRRFYCTRK